MLCLVLTIASSLAPMRSPLQRGVVTRTVLVMGSRKEEVPMLNLSMFVESEVMTVIHVERQGDSEGYVPTFWKGGMRLYRVDRRLESSELVIIHGRKGTPSRVAAVNMLYKENAGEMGSHYLTVHCPGGSDEYPRLKRGRRPGQIEFAREVEPVDTLIVAGRAVEAKLVVSYIPDVKVGDAVVVDGTKAVMRAPQAPMGRVVTIVGQIDDCTVTTLDAEVEGVALLAEGLRWPRGKAALLDFTGNVIIQILD